MATKKTVAKTVKKAKSTTKKVVKKATKKVAKKAAKRAVKRAVKKAVRKVIKKAAKDAVKKLTGSKMARRIIAENKSDNVVYTEIIVSPELAEQFLELGGVNRNLRPKQTRDLIRRMKAGEWVGNNGETLKISSNSTIMDGQHRLTALIQSGMTLTMTFAFNIAPEHFKTIGVGTTRSLGDIFSMAGLETPGHLATTTDHVYHADKFGSLLNDEKMSPEALLKYFKRNRKLQDSLNFTRAALKGVKIGRVLHTGLLAATFHLFRQKDEALAKNFIGGLIRGTGPLWNDGNALWMLRDRFLSEMKKGFGKRRHRLCLIIKAWNNIREGNPTKRAVWRINDLPEIV